MRIVRRAKRGTVEKVLRTRELRRCRGRRLEMREIRRLLCLFTGVKRNWMVRGWEKKWYVFKHSPK
jgi:hypothetical protein